jgi:hypothetical protein
MTMQEFKPLVKEMLDSGWKMAAPDAETFKAEDEGCNKTVCTHCGNKGLAYMPFTGPARPKPAATLSTYRAFAICSRCGHVKEI